VTGHAWLLLGAYLAILLLLAKPLGIYIGHVMKGRLPTWLGGAESLLYRLCGIRKDDEMGWLNYALAILLFNALGTLTVYGLQRLQVWLPLNPQSMANVGPDSAFNTAVSFATNTNWQGYAGESTMSYLTQMLGLAVQNFLSAATGIVVVIALIRGFARHTSKTIGNAWVDLTRITLFVLLPISMIYAVFLVGQGVIQNIDAYKNVTTL
jgi:K+-transporting ATPase ATPase A chain